MATINATIERLRDQSVIVATFSNMAKGDVGAPLPFAEWADRSVQVTGTWDSATLVWQGSNDGATWFTLNDPDGNAISKTANFLEAVMENCLYVRPSIGGAGGTTALTVVVVARRQSGMRT